MREGRQLPDDWVPCSTYWLVNAAGEMLGSIDLRHSLDSELLRTWGGHIGYAVHPNHRRKGYATFMVREVFKIARGMGLMRVQITCDAENSASRGVIEKCGGVLQDSIYVEERNAMVNRYWVAL